MVVKKEISLLPASMRGSISERDGKSGLRLQIAILLFIVCWLAALSVRSWQPGPSADSVDRLMSNNEVRLGEY